MLEALQIKLYFQGALACAETDFNEARAEGSPGAAGQLITSLFNYCTSMRQYTV
jgi:hypothetical protein